MRMRSLVAFGTLRRTRRRSARKDPSRRTIGQDVVVLLALAATFVGMAWFNTARSSGLVDESESRPTPTPDASEAEGTPWFDGAVHGWRVAPYQVLEAESLQGRNLNRSCEPQRRGAEARTDLDYAPTYLPSQYEFKRRLGPDKWLCAGQGLSVTYIYEFESDFGTGELTIDRALRGRRSLTLAVPADSVEAGYVKGLPAIFAHPDDDVSGEGLGQVIVIEDDTGPEFTVLRLSAEDGIPFNELLKIAEGVVTS